MRLFLHTRIDFTGYRRKEKEKMYILLFMHFTIRAVHLELVNDISPYSVVLSLVQLFNLFGVHSDIYSDNAHSFVAGYNLVKQFFVSDEFVEMFSTFNIKHLTIPLYAVWFSSIWERLIKIVKCCLFKLVGRKSLEYFKFLTVLSDVQNAINSQLLAYCCSEDAGLDIITPNASHHQYLPFLERSGKGSGVDFSSQRSSVEFRDLYLKGFHDLWYEEYLLNLREQSKNLFQVVYNNIIKVSDVVVVKNPTES